jgi:hypothetical protein
MLPARLIRSIFPIALRREATGDLDRLAVLADALEDAGCTESALLGQMHRRERHVRVCFVIDALMGQS